MKLKRKRPGVVAALCGVFAMAGILLGQQTADAPAQAVPGKIVVAVNAVLVPVVVRDAEGRSVGNLKQEDFQVFDKNKQLAISGFTIQKRASVEGSGANAAEALPANRGPAQPTAATALRAQNAPDRFIVYLFDDLHLSSGDLMALQKAATKMVAGSSLTNTDMAAVVSLSGTSSGLTNDREKLQDAIMNLKAQTLTRRIGRVCPDIGYYEADRILNKHDFMALDTAIENTMGCCECTKNVAQGLVDNAASESLQVGDRDVRMTLGFIRGLVGKMGTMPGQRTLVIISPGFLTMTPDAMMEKSQILNMAAQSSVTINAVDARGLFTATMEASDQGRGTSRAERTEAQYRGYSAVLNEDVMAELADGTGGTYFHNSNDLQGGLQELTVVPEYVYLLELSLQKVKADGSYHPLKVKVDKDGSKVAARRGYLAPRAVDAKNAK
ncbi:MAG: VWA domain-containing protein [Candidatus Acidiferrum sp.]|jgi:VWFA-related protein